MSDLKQAAIDAILDGLAFDSVKELRAYVSKNKQDDYFYGGILYAINAVQDLSSAQPKSEERTAESAQNVPNDELISKKAAMEAHCELCEDKGLCGDICPDVEVFRLIPSAQPEQAVKDCRNCKHGKYNDYHDTYFCYNAEDCSNWDKWETSALHKYAQAEIQPEIIRCKDCKYYQFAGNRAFGFPVIRCEFTGFEDVDDDDFCSRGERRTEE